MNTTTASPSVPRPAGSDDHPAGRGLGRRRASVVVSAATAAALAAALTGCVTFELPGPAVYTTVEHEVSADIHAVHLDTAGDLTITLGDTPGLVITTLDSVHPLLTVTEKSGTLVLERRGPGWNGSIEYELIVTSLDAVSVDGSGGVIADFTTGGEVSIDLDGSGSVTARGIDAVAVAVNLDGSGSIVLEGTTETVAVSLDGSGSIEAVELIARTGTAALAGSGSIGVHATSEMAAELEGSGSIRVAGSPRLSEDVRGSGSIAEIR
ncbi:DUF2807 domain-containing protein [Salinibacterium sp. ZJ77]|uniref:GIN domain-containing protein n=1 Tax=Salinibacterium sp. ZJ77 TaxID=2708337 RepID=UPI001423E796|nr:DUF2807 domain-containing protein [Salinibacterium sp. ZJ77]